ncbi:unnamed protein product [Brachionus calyciflorus]|uniref:Uncharacterized protein n=1 Tax=Brachionus calyciflorus TaxID=104777 RepID=A0A814I9N2_9BILA|nr:unnamed protein product [Brachionus calyciflorus]
MHYFVVSGNDIGKGVENLFLRSLKTQISRSCLGLGIYYVNANNEIDCINFDIISSDLTEDARAVVRGFRLLRQQKFFKNIEKNSYIVWMDCGKHFRNFEVIGYLLKDLAEQKIDGN